MLIKTLSSSPKTKKWLLTIFAWLIALSIGTYFRLYPLLHFKTPAIHNQSEQYVHNLIHQKIAQDIQIKHPNLSDKEKHALHEKLFQSVLIQDAVQLKATIKKVAIDLDTPASENRQFPYLLASDSFYYFHLTEQIHELGRFPYSIKGSKYHHTLMMAPHGHYEPFNLHPFVGYYLYQFLKIFNPDIPLMQAVSFTPLLLSAIALLAFFWVGTLLQCRLSNIFISAVFFILAPIFVKRSTLGWYDNDPYNVIFPLLIIGCIFKSLPVDSNSRRRYLYTILSFVLMWFYTYFWQGWMMFFSVIFLSGITIILYNHFILRKSKATKSLSLIFLLFTVGSFIMVALTFGPGEFLTLFNEGWKALGDFLNPQLALWPDLYISVGELRPATWDYIIEFTGGPILFFTAIISLICSIYQAAVNPEKRNPFQIIILGAFFFAALFITKGAQRFAMLCLIPESLFFMIGLEYIRIFINFIFKKIYKRPIISHDYLLTILLVGLTFFPIHHMTTTIKSLLNQIFNTAWENTLLKIKDQTPPESVINAWWPPGHFIKAIAQRRVTFDGASINYPQAYWMAHLLLLPTEEEALGILRMLNNSGNDAAEFLTSLGIQLSTAVLILKEISSLPPQQAAVLLSKFLSREQILTLLKLTHAKPPPSYILLYNQFIAANLQLGLLGRWNFTEIENINSHPDQIKKIPKKGSKDYIKFLWDLVGGQLKYSGPLSIRRQKENTIVFQENLTLDLNQMSCRINSTQYGRGIPFSLFYLDEQNNVVEKQQNKANLPFSVFLYKEGASYKSILMDRALAQSFLMRLYFYNAAGMKYIKPFTYEIDTKTNTEIKVFEVDWEKFK